MSDVFISYSRRDIAFARLIREALQQSEIDTWIDWDRIPVGERWWQEITEAIEGANIFMLIISRNSLGSKVCRDEIELALQNHKRIVPILVDQLTPEEIAGLAPDLPQFNWVVFERDHIFRLEVDPSSSSDKAEDREIALAKMPQFEEALRKLSVAIHTDWEWVKYHTRLQVEALRWDNNGRDASYLVRGTALEEAEQQLFRAAGRDPAPTSLQVEFVTASRHEEARRQQERLVLERKARRRQRYVLAAVAVGLVVSSTLGVVAWGQRNQALSEANARATAQAQTEQQRQVAVQQRDIAVSRQLAAQALNQVDNGDPSLGLLLAMEAQQRADTMDARSSLLRLSQTESRLRYYMYAHSDSVNGVAVSPNGGTMASASDDDTIAVWDSVTGKASRTLSGNGHFGAVSFSPDGAYLASGSSNGEIVLWDVAKGYASEVVATGDAPVGSLAFSRDGSLLAAGTGNGSAEIYSMVERKLVCPSMNVLTDAFRANVAFSPDGKTLAIGGGSSSGNSNLSFWDTATCKQLGGRVDMAVLANKQGNTGESEVSSLAYSPDGKQLSLAVADVLVVIDPTTHQSLRPPALYMETGISYVVTDVTYSPDGGTEAVSLGNESVVLLNPLTGDAAGLPLVGYHGAVEAVAFGPDGHTLVSGDSAGAVIVWDLASQSIGRTIMDQTGAAAVVAFSPDSRLLACGSKDQAVRLWDTTTWQTVGQPFGDGHGEIRSVAFKPGGTVVATGGEDGQVYMWDVATGRPLESPPDGLGRPIDAIAFSPDGKWLAAGGDGNRLALWDASNAQVLSIQADPPVAEGSDAKDLYHIINSVGFTSDSTALYFSQGAGLTRFVSLATSPPDLSQARQLTWSSVTGDIKSAIAPDGKTIALASVADVRLYDIESGKMIGLTMYGHTGLVDSLAFTPDGRILASGAQDGTVRLWDTATGQAVGLPIKGPSKWLSDMVLSPDGKWLATGGGDGTVRVVDLKVEDWKSVACDALRRNLSNEEWRQFLPTEPYRLTCPNQTADITAAGQITELARSLREAGRTDEAQSVIADTLAWLVPSGHGAFSNDLCWKGSLDGFAAQVMPACEQAVSLASSPHEVAGDRDSRGLARALTGNSSGAIEDFQAFVDWSKQNDNYDPDGKQREAWIAALKQGKNPFDQTTLESLRS